MKRRTVGALAAALTLLATAPAMARPIPAGGVTRQELATWLLDQGYSAEIHNDEGGVSIISSTVGPVNYDIYFYDCSGSRCGSLTFLAGWTPSDTVTLDEVNGWNAKKRFVFAYRDSDRNLWAQYDIDVGSGASWEEMSAGLSRWESGAVAFKDFIDRDGQLD